MKKIFTFLKASNTYVLLISHILAHALFLELTYEYLLAWKVLESYNEGNEDHFNYSHKSDQRYKKI